MATRKSELDGFKAAVVSKKNELADFNNKLKDVNNNVRLEHSAAQLCRA